MIIIFNSKFLLNKMFSSFSASNSTPATPAVPFDWKMAQEEVMQADLSNDPIQVSLSKIWFDFDYAFITMFY